MIGNQADARAYFEDGVRASPDYGKNYYSLGVLEALAGRDEQAIRYLREAVKKDPDYAQAHFVLADALRRSGHAADALTEYREVLRRDGRNTEARFGSAIAMVQLGNFPEAVSALEEGMMQHPDDARFSHALARVLGAAPVPAVRDGRRAVAIVQSLIKQGISVQLAETAAMALAEAGRFDEAVTWQRRAITAAESHGEREMARLMADNLALYERRQPCRTPWRPSDPIFTPSRPAPSPVTHR
jgi:tetratricopeptide (TPR) repeat protein